MDPNNNFRFVLLMGSLLNYLLKYHNNVIAIYGVNMILHDSLYEYILFYE